MRWRWRITLALFLLGVPGWLIAGHTLCAPRLIDELHASVGIRPTISFVFVSPLLNLHAINIRFEDERVTAHVPVARFDIPASKFWGRGRTERVTARKITAHIRTQADLSRLQDPHPGSEGEEGGEPSLPPVLRCDEVAIYIEDEVGSAIPLLISDWLLATPTEANRTDVEFGAGEVGPVVIEGASAEVVSMHGHLLVTDFRMRAFHGDLHGFVDLHLERAGAYNGELTCDSLDVQAIARRFSVPDAFRREGRLSGEVRFHAERPRFDRIKGSGTLRMHDARFFSPVNFRIVGVLGLPQRKYSYIRSAELAYTMDRGLIYLEKGAIRSEDYELQVRGLFDIDGGVDIEASYHGTTLAVYGRLVDPTIKILPFDVFTVPFDRPNRPKLRRR